MKIDEKQSAVLSNYEVLSFIQTKKATWAKQGRTDTVPRNVTRIVKNVESHLTRPSSALEPGPNSEKYSPAAIRRLLEILQRQPWSLPLGELMAVLNIRPANTAQLDAVIEENSERFSDEQMEEMAGIIREVLGGKEGQGEGGGEGEEAE